VLAKPTSKLNQAATSTGGTPTNSSKNLKTTTTTTTTAAATTLPPHLIQQKRLNTLNTRSSYRSKLMANNMSNSNEKLLTKTDKSYTLTNQFAESADFLFKFNHQILVLNKITVANGLSLTKMLNNLHEFIEVNLKNPLDSKELFGYIAAPSSSSSLSATNTAHPPPPPPSSSDQTLFVVERIEFVSRRLNDEMLKLINYFLFNSKNVNETLKVTSYLNRPINSLAVIDFLCLAFQICYNLFLLRTSYILLANKQMSSNKSELDATLFKKLIVIKEEMFLLIVKLLQSINFSTENKPSESIKVNQHNTNGSKLNNLNSTNASSSSSSSRSGSDSALLSYTTLKILITIIDCFNKIVYLPNLNQIFEPDSLTTLFYVGLIDNMHGILNKFKMLKILSNKKVNIL
jgi:hypothetical protein